MEMKKDIIMISKRYHVSAQRGRISYVSALCTSYAVYAAWATRGMMRGMRDIKRRTKMESNINMIKNDVKERELKPMSGMAMLFINSIGTLVGIALCIAGPAMFDGGVAVLLVDTGNSYWGLSQLIHNRTHGEDGIYFTYTNENPIAFNPFYVEDGVFDIEKKESIKTLILTLWKRDDEAPKRSEEVALSNAVSAYIERIGNDRSVTPCFNTFYEFVRDDYRQRLAEKNVREKDFDIDNFLNVLEPYYRGGEYDYLLNSDKELDLLHKRFIVFELDNIKDHKILFPITTIIIMEAFINKMRKLKGIRKLILIEEAWKAIASANMADYIKYLYKTVRKYFGEAIVVTQEVEDIISSPIVKESIINNSDCKILLDQRKYLNKFDSIQNLLGLTDKERSQILSINMANHPGRKYKEVFISLGGTQSAVYATEVSLDEYYTYTTEESEKMELFALADKLGGNLELAIKRLAESKRNPQSSTT